MTGAEEIRPVRMPRELVLASAGTGKTHWISNRIIGLLEAGVRPDQMIASTFTRKAAGEILDRVLERMAEAALSEQEAATLAEQACLRDATLGPEGWSELLRSTLRELHRSGVSTLDAFFLGTVRCFAAELGLPPVWTIVDEPTDLTVRSDALDDILAAADRSEVVELVRMLMRGQASRLVHTKLLEQSTLLVRLRNQIDPEAASPWMPFDVPSLDTVRRELDAQAAREAIAAALEAAELPTKTDGEPDGRFLTARDKHVEQILAGDWESLCGGLGGKVLDGSLKYYRKPFPPSLEDALRAGLDRARDVIGAELNQQASARGRLADDFAAALARRRRQQGAYRFEDVTRFLYAGERIGARPDLWHRLDRSVEHLLLDEFQDTSLEQWEALRPLAERLLDGDNRTAHAGIVVADPKQSIYGWRGAEPELVRRVARRFSLEPQTLSRSYRSSQIVLDLVNRVFETLTDNRIWDGAEGAEEDRAIAGDWASTYKTHTCARERPGHVRVEVGPRDASMRKTDRPQMMAYAARRVADLAAGAPGRSIGVLVRTNRAVARLIAELRTLGVGASEEGGSRLTDVAVVEAVLSLLRLADHPGNTISRYLVAKSPLGKVVGLDDPVAASTSVEIAASVREALVRDGYGPTLAKWVKQLGELGTLDRRDIRRLLQLVEIGYRWDERATLRPGDFVRLVESEGVSDATTTPVRVMTVHQAKGLEFDIVVLPELDTKLTSQGSGDYVVLAERDPETGLVRKVFPYMNKAIRPLFREADVAGRQARAAALRDSLGVLYVALTRARHSLHMFIAADDPEKGAEPRATYSWLLRWSLDLGDRQLQEGEVIESGDPEWAAATDTELGPGPVAALAGDEPETSEFGIRLRAASARRRLVPHTSPSALEGGGLVDLRWALRLDSAPARDRGTIAHLWLEQIGWIEDGIPEDEDLRRIARELRPRIAADDLECLLADFHGWLEKPTVREALSRTAYGDEARVETELAFAGRAGDAVVRGLIDRLILLGPSDSPGAAEVVDFKTDVVTEDTEELERRAAFYAPQLQAYREAVANAFGLGLQSVAGRLVFLEAGAVRVPRDA